jgi:hypothetical protein
MASAHWTLLLFVAASGLCGCDSASSDLATVKTARSLAAERALVAELDARTRLRPAYSEGMQRAAVQQIVSARGQLSNPDGTAGRAIGAAAVLPDKAEPLQDAVRRLIALEKQREDQ